MIDKHGEELISDFLYYYRIDLGDVLVPGKGLSARRAIALIRNLPPESATVAAVRGGSEFRGWGTDRYLLAAIVDAIQENTHAFISANSKRKPKAPQPIPRPEKAAEKRAKPNLFSVIATQRLNRNKQIKRGN